MYIIRDGQRRECMAEDIQKERINGDTVININALIEEYDALNKSKVDTNQDKNEHVISLPSDDKTVDDLTRIIKNILSPYDQVLDILTDRLIELEKQAEDNKEDTNEKHSTLEYYVLERVAKIEKALEHERTKNKKYRQITLSIVTVYTIIMFLLFYFYR